MKNVSDKEMFKENHKSFAISSALMELPVAYTTIAVTLLNDYLILHDYAIKCEHKRWNFIQPS